MRNIMRLYFISPLKTQLASLSAEHFAYLREIKSFSVEAEPRIVGQESHDNF
jgi:hypothetical protein